MTLYCRILTSNNRIRYIKQDQFLIFIKEARHNLFKNKTNNNFKNKRDHLVDTKIPNKLQEKLHQNKISMIFKDKVQLKNTRITCNS